MSFLRYFFYPNPNSGGYTSPTMAALLVLCAILVIGSVAIRYWRASVKNPITKKLSRSWAGAAMTFGIVGFILVISRVEHIQFFAMRFLWVLWGLAALGFVLLQLRLFKAKHYEVLPRAMSADARDPYLPTKKKRR